MHDTKAPRGDVVVVEDDHSVRLAIGRLLETAGFRVRTFESAEALLVGEPALATDCLIVDAHLPGMSGPDLCRELRRTGIAPPVIIITAHDDAQHRQEAADIGAAAYLAKPFPRQALIQAVADAIGASPTP